MLQNSARSFKLRLDRVAAVFTLRVDCSKRGVRYSRRENMLDPSLDRRPWRCGR